MRRRIAARIDRRRDAATGGPAGEDGDANPSTDGVWTPEQRAELAQRTYREMARRYRPAERLHGSMMLVKPGGANESDFGWGRYVDGEVQALKLAQLRDALAR
jgi:hypothetical protein